MNKITKITSSIFFIMILLIVPNIQAAEFQVVKNNIEKQIEEGYIDEIFVKTLDIWGLLEFLFALLINLVNFIIKLFQNFIRILLIPLNLFNYLIWAILQILFPH